MLEAFKKYYIRMFKVFENDVRQQKRQQGRSLEYEYNTTWISSLFDLYYNCVLHSMFKISVIFEFIDNL